MKEVIERLYAEELKLITPKPVMLRDKPRTLLKKIKSKAWDKQNVAAKIAIMSLTLLFISGSVYYYNMFTTKLFMVHLESAQIEAELQRRSDLIPGLVKAVAEYMQYEGKVFVHAADVRSALGSLKDLTADSTSLPVDMQTLTNFKTAISKFQAVAENYPDLKSSVTYQNLMNELANTETRLAMARAKYNTAANIYNTSLELVPGFFFAYPLGFRHAKTFIADKAEKTVKLPAAVK